MKNNKHLLHQELTQLIHKATRSYQAAEMDLHRVELDSSISRSYHSMAHAIEALFLTKNLQASSHEETIQLFKQHFIETMLIPPRLRNYLDDAYYIKRMDEITGKVVLNWAKEFVEEVKNFLIREQFISAEVEE